MKQLLLICILFSVAIAHAETIINGTVVDAKGGGLPGANVFLKDTYDGATTDEKGFFTFTTSEVGEQTLTASLVGFKTAEQKINLSGGTQTIKIKLLEVVNQLKAVTIAAGAFEASDEKKMVMLRPLDIVTTAGASGDIYGAIQTLPGTGIVGEKEGLYVRGGDATETKTFIDGLPVDNPYFSSVPNVPQRGRFSPFIFKGTSFSSGGYSAQYGQAMSSALILETQDLPDRSMTNAGIMSVGLSLGHTKKWKRSAVGVFGGYTDLAPYYAIMKQNREWNRAPYFSNVSVIAKHQTNHNGFFKAMINYGTSDLSLAVPDTSDPLLINTLQFKNKNHNFFSNASYRQLLNNKWTIYVAASLSDNKDNIHVDEYPVNRQNDFFASRLSLSRTMGELSVIRFGTELQLSNFRNVVPVYTNNFDETYSSYFAEADLYITQNLVARPGIRAEYSEILNRTNVAPRVSLAYKTGKETQVSFAYGDFYQVPEQSFLQLNNSLQFEKATHYILNLQQISEYRTFRVEIYYKDYNHLVRNSTNELNNSGYGHAKGIELFYRDKKLISMSDLWVSYSYLDTKRLYRDYPSLAMPSFAANHTGSVVYKYFIPKISLAPSVTYSFATGRPYYNPNNPSFLSDRTKNYHNLSLNFSYLTSIKKSFTVLVLSVSNLLGIENVFTYEYSSDGSHRIAIGPTADRMIFIGAFINIGSQIDDSDKYE